MNDKDLNFKLDEIVQMLNSDDKSENFIVDAFTEDEAVLKKLKSTNTSITDFPIKEIVLSRTIVYNEIKISIGDKVKLINKKGNILKVYVVHILNMDYIIVSKRICSSGSALKWIVQLMNCE